MTLKSWPRLALVAAMAAAPCAHATIFACGIATATLDVADNGRVAVSIQGSSTTGNIYICNMSSSTDAPGAQGANVATETCRSWYNTIMFAKAANKAIYAMFDTTYTRAGSAGVSSCDAVISSQNWTYPNPMPDFIQINY